MKFPTLFSIFALGGAISVHAAEAPHHGRRLGGYSESFCARSLQDCCGPQTGTEGVTDDIPYPNCRCPKRQKGGAEEPFLFFGSYGGDTGICATCEEKYPDLSVGNAGTESN